MTSTRNNNISWPTAPVPPPDPLLVWSDDNLQKVANLWNLCEADVDGMKKLRERISDIRHWKNDPFEAIRYYQEYKGQLDKIEQKFREMIEWRRKNNMEAFLKYYGSPPVLFHQLPVCVLQGTDKDGDPIYVARIGACDFYPLLKHFGTDAVVEYVIFIREMTNHPEFWKSNYEQQTSHRVRNYTVIFDLEGLGTRHLKSGIRAAMKRTSRISQDFYAGWCKRILYIRAPAISTYVWNLVKPLFDPQLQEVMQVSGHSDYLQMLDKYIDREVLPAEICPIQGKGTAMKGYFENVNLQGGPILTSMFREQQEHPNIKHHMKLRSTRILTKTKKEEQVLGEIIMKGFWDLKVGTEEKYYVEIDS